MSWKARREGVLVASSYGTDADKSSLRRGYLTARRSIPALSKEASDAAIRYALCRSDIFREASCVLSYVSFGNEVDTLVLLEGLLAEGRRVAVPRCDAETHRMRFCVIESLDELAPGAHGILEPPAAAHALTVPEMVRSVCLVPGLVFDGAGYRVGYGGGYYDRFLWFYPGDKVGLARTMMLSSNPLPHDEHDLPVDFLATEAGMWLCPHHL